MGIFLVGLVFFLGVHSVSIVSPRWRDAQVARLGARGWKGLYTLVSIAGLALLVWGYGVARLQPLVLYTPPRALQHFALLLLVPVFPLFVAPYFPGRIAAAARHPQLLAVKIWATAHLLANGTLVDVVLFGAFLAWAVADRISFNRRPARPVPGAPPRPANDVIVVVLGLALYALFLWGAHQWLTGVSPLASLQ